MSNTNSTPVLPRLPDLFWTWWTRPVGAQLNGTLYLGGVGRAGTIEVATVDEASGLVLDRFVLADHESDDHNNPAVLVAAGLPVFAFYQRHNADNLIRWRKSTAPESIAAFEAESTINFGSPVSYAEAWRSGSEIHLFCRVGTSKWGYTFTSDEGATWAAPRLFADFGDGQQMYVATALLDDGVTLRLAAGGHPANSSVHDMRYLEANLASGALVADAVTVGNLRTGANLPLAPEAMELAWSCPVGRTSNMLDVGTGPTPEIAFASKDDDSLSTTDPLYHVARKTGSWAVDDLVDAGSIFGYSNAGMYLGGMAFPADGRSGVVYLSRSEPFADRQRWLIERYDLVGGAWVPTVIRRECGRIVRPMPIYNADRYALTFGSIGYYGPIYEDYAVDALLVPADLA